MSRAHLALILVFLAGCGSRTHPVVGRIVYSDGTPAGKEVAGYVVTLESIEQTVGGTATVDDEGVFRISTYQPNDGAIPGKHRVAITPPYEASDAPRPRSILDPKYMDLGKSELEIDVRAGMGEVVLRVEKAKK